MFVTAIIISEKIDLNDIKWLILIISMRAVIEKIDLYFEWFIRRTAYSEAQMSLPWKILTQLWAVWPGKHS